MSIEVTCTCGNIKQRVKCATSEARPEGNRERKLKCTDACVVAKRNLALAEALGIEKREVKVKEVEYDPIITSFYIEHVVRTLTRFEQDPANHDPVFRPGVRLWKLL